MRLWKRVFAVLHHHSLFLYKDKREAVLHGAGAGPCLDEHPPIIIWGCLIDIAYSETKRKHTLRLTTQDFCEYLLQAEDRDDMLSWIRVIREGSKTDNEVTNYINSVVYMFSKHKQSSSGTFLLGYWILQASSHQQEAEELQEAKVSIGLGLCIRNMLCFNKTTNVVMFSFCFHLETVSGCSLTGNKADSSTRGHRMIPPFLLVKTDNTLMNKALRSGGY